jgi:diphosphomevalonate decarboxylase
VFSRVKQGVAEKNFRAVAEWMEHSTLAMHATMMTSVPPIVYLRGASVELIHRITEARAGGLEVAFTMDAGPNVKVLTTPSSADEAQRLLAEHPGVERVIVCRPGPGAARLALQGPLERAGRADGVDLGPFAANKAAK